VVGAATRAGLLQTVKPGRRVRRRERIYEPELPHEAAMPARPAARSDRPVSTKRHRCVPPAEHRGEASGCLHGSQLVCAGAGVAERTVRAPRTRAHNDHAGDSRGHTAAERRRLGDDTIRENG
jgi:hypothetical protein